MKLYQNPSSGSRVAPSGRTYEQADDETSNHCSQLCEHANLSRCIKDQDCLRTYISCVQWRTQEFFSWGVQQIQLRTEGRENGVWVR
jgi:hypothetical protein